MGQPSCYQFQIQCDRHPALQGKHHMLKPCIVAARRATPEESPDKMSKCKYPVWALNRVKIRMKTPAHKNQQKNKSFITGNQKQNYIVVPYYKWLSESLKRTCQKYGVQVYFKGGNTIKSLLMAPKDKDPLMKNSGVTYRYECDRWSVMRNI